MNLNNLPNLDENVKTFINENSKILPDKKKIQTRDDLLLKLRQKRIITSKKRLSRYSLEKKVESIKKKIKQDKEKEDFKSEKEKKLERNRKKRLRKKLKKQKRINQTLTSS